MALLVGLLPMLADGARAATRADWGAKPPMPTVREHLSAATAGNGKLYAIGGFGASGAGVKVEEYDSSLNVWTTKRNMPTSRFDLAVAAAPDGKVYAFGGTVSGAMPLATVEEYDPDANTWRDRAPMPTARQALGAALAPNGKIYVIGGQAAGGLTNLVDEYDPSTNTWRGGAQGVAQMPTARKALGVALGTNGKIYAIGGIGASNIGLNVVEEYDPQANTWRTMAPLPYRLDTFGLALGPNGWLYAIGGMVTAGDLTSTFPVSDVRAFDPTAGPTGTWSPAPFQDTVRFAHAAATAPNGKIYIAGGKNSSTALATLAELDVSLGRWSSGPTSIVPISPWRANHGQATGLNGRPYVIGGANESGNLASTQEYNPVVNSPWVTMASMPGGARLALGVAAHPNGKIYAVGGNNGGFLGRLEEYTPDTDTWRSGTPDLPTMPVPRQGLGAAVGSDGRLYAAGGYNGTDRNELHAWTVGATSWTTLAPMHIGRQLTTLVATPQGTLYVFGGYNALGCPAPTCNPAEPPGPQHSVEMYSIATNTWTMRAPMPTARNGMAAVRALNGKIYVIGGQTSPSNILDTVEEYDPNANTWRTIQAMPRARTSFGLSLLQNGRAIASGGYDSSTVLNDVDALTISDVPTAQAGGPYSVVAGGSVQLNGSVANPDGRTLSYAWDLDGDLLYEASGQNPAFSAAGLAPGAHTVRVRAMDALGTFGVATTTVNVLTACAVRPNVGVTLSKPAAGQLLATLAAHTSVAAPTNSLNSIRITKIANAAVQVNGAAVAEGQTVTLPANAQQATLLVRRATPGQASTVSFAATDACGEWKSFVGGGAGAF
jgi:N-acetylneuraminic acid mutarotase